KVGIIGIGGLGQFAAGMALIDDMDLYIADVSPDARKLAEEMGIKHVYENVLDMADAGCEVIVDYAGFGTTTAGAIEAVAPGGTVVV
ncbi:MAG TPA: alcohol dehydrogenase, partial [Peptococcaceae bacterium]|nr:alcohol dehydrogenase [Peptococcaceae bacterium]